ncbi:MAG: 6-phosphogluconate dehydrogenase (decarboxylating), partial [bacterium]|nr:6-phosphogluconate dehydrogenase (decarboxylating) [bacterium]
KNYALLGKTGAGHFVKMVHNGIEYGMMEAIAEGFAVLEKSRFKLDLAQVAKVWHQGAVVSSWLVDLARDIFEKENFDKVVGYIHHTGEGEWTIRQARKLGVDVRVIRDSFKVRLESSQKKHQNKFSNKLVALLRNRFGGHEVTKK